MTQPSSIPGLDRFLFTLSVVERELRHLEYSRERVFTESIDTAWVHRLDEDPVQAERLEAFVSRFGRTQDTIAGKLIPRWLNALAEEPGSQLEALNRGERLGVVEDVEHWLEARALRNRLVHEYMDDPRQFAADLSLAESYVNMLFTAWDRIRTYAEQRMKIPSDQLPSRLADAR